jgi:hypothetical protein
MSVRVFAMPGARIAEAWIAETGQTMTRAKDRH